MRGVGRGLLRKANPTKSNENNTASATSDEMVKIDHAEPITDAKNSTQADQAQVRAVNDEQGAQQVHKSEREPAAETRNNQSHVKVDDITRENCATNDDNEQQQQQQANVPQSSSSQKLKSEHSETPYISEEAKSFRELADIIDSEKKSLNALLKEKHSLTSMASIKSN